MNLKEKIKDTNDIRKETVKVPEWDVKIEIRTMTGVQRSLMMNRAIDKKGTILYERMYPDMVIACCYDPKTGEQIFEEADKDWLMEKSCSAIELIATKAMRLSGLVGIEEAEKN